MFKAALWVLIVGLSFLGKSFADLGDDLDEVAQPRNYQKYKNPHEALEAFVAQRKAATQNHLREWFAGIAGMGLIVGSIFMFRNEYKSRGKRRMYRSVTSIAPRAHILRQSDALKQLREESEGIRCSYEELGFVETSVTVHRTGAS